MGRKTASRRGLVLGAGGVLGSAWMIGALRAYETETGQDVRHNEVIVGTSAGSVIASLLGLGVGTEVMVNSERGLYEPGYPVLDYRNLGSSLPPRPRMRMGSPRLLTSTALHPRRATPMMAIAALLPQGRGKISAVGDLVMAAVALHLPVVEPLAVKRSAAVPPGVRTLDEERYRPDSRNGQNGRVGQPGQGERARRVAESGRTRSWLVDHAGVTDHGWPVAPELRVVAMDFDTGGRVLFGADESPWAPLARAVMASCAIPGWYAPIDIGGRRFVDGGTRSPASVDLLAEEGLDEVLVLAPACSFESDRPRGAVARLERQMRRAATRRLEREIALVEAAGTRVTVLCPGPEDLEVIGGNVMDLTRRAQVFETSLYTSVEALRSASAGGGAGSGRASASGGSGAVGGTIAPMTIAQTGGTERADAAPAGPVGLAGQGLADPETVGVGLAG